MISIKIVGAEEVAQRFAAMPVNVRQSLVIKTYAAALMLENYIKTSKLSGQVLSVRSGRLRRSVQSRVTDVDGTIYGQVYTSGDVPYAGIHEFGGHTSPHEIYATKARALAFLMNGKQVFFRHVHHPGSRIPERSYMRSALLDKSDDIRQMLARAVEEAVRGTA